MNVLELFAGIGGMSLGLERAGMTVVAEHIGRLITTKDRETARPTTRAT